MQLSALIFSQDISYWNFLFESFQYPQKSPQNCYKRAVNPAENFNFSVLDAINIACLIV